MSTFTRSTTGFIHTTSRKNVSTLREALPQIIAVSIKNVVLIGFGMSLGFPTILIAGLEDPEEEMHVTTEQISWLGSINLIFVPIGCLLSGPISQKIGRKRTMQIANVPLVAAWLLFRFSAQIWQIYLGLAMFGFLLGCIESSVITYVAEITTPKLRGILASTGSVSIILGILLEFLLGTFFQWRDAVLISITVPVIATNLLILAPESPYWLLAKSKNTKAQNNLAWLRGWISIEDVDTEYKNIYKDLNQTVYVHSGTVKTSKKAAFLRPFTLVIFVFFLRHFNGITNLQTYAVEVFATFQTPINKYYTTSLLGLVEVLGCCVCVVFIHITGKRMLTFITVFLSGFCLIGVATYATVNGITQLQNNINITHVIDEIHQLENGANINNLQNNAMVYGIYDQNITVTKNNDLFIYDTNHLHNITIFDYNLEISNWVPTGLLLAHAFLTNASLRILPWLLTGEVFPTEIRSCSVGVTTAIAYLLGFASNKIFFNVIQFLTLPGIFFGYALLSFLGLAILYFVLPETEGKSLIEITELFARGNGIDLNSNSNQGMARRTSDLYGINFDLINTTNEVNTYKKFTDIEVPL